MLLEAITHVVIDEAPSAGTSPLTWLPVVTALIAAVSAYLSWRSVTQAKEISDRSLLPVLAPVLSLVGDKLSLSVTVDLLGRFRDDKAVKEATYVGSTSRLVPYV